MPQEDPDFLPGETNLSTNSCKNLIKSFIKSCLIFDYKA